MAMSNLPRAHMTDLHREVEAEDDDVDARWF
jgi:hypothetical protein